MPRTLPLVRAVIAVSLVLVAGCGAPGTGAEQGVDAPTVSVEPGERGNVTIDARGVTSLRVGTVETESVTFDWTNATVRPGPDTTYTSQPPAWVWDEPMDRVTVRLPYAVADDVAPGEYRYSVTASVGRSGDDSEVTGNATFVVE